MRSTIHLLFVAIVFVASQTPQSKAEIYVFGDSLSETGNFYAATGGMLPPSPLYFDGRFSNGKAWVEHFARVTGEPPPFPSTLGGTNFAFNGSRAAGVSPYGTPDLTQQVFSYLWASGGSANSDDIFVIWAGSNDIFFGATAGESEFISNAIEGIKWSIKALHTAGARNIVLLDLPPLGQTPFFNTIPGISTQLNAASSAFNSNLAIMTRSLRHELPHVRIADVKVSRLFESVSRSPRLFGLQNVTNSATNYDPVTGIGYELALGVDPRRFLFWDSVHPTAQGHKIIAAYVLIDYTRHCRNR